MYVYFDIRITMASFGSKKLGHMVFLQDIVVWNVIMIIQCHGFVILYIHSFARAVANVELSQY